jgi:hypothetical protein
MEAWKVFVGHQRASSSGAVGAECSQGRFEQLDPSILLIGVIEVDREGHCRHLPASELSTIDGGEADAFGYWSSFLDAFGGV